MNDQSRRDVLKGIGGTVVLVSAGSGVVAAEDDRDADPPDDESTIVDVASAVPRFSILVDAVERAGLVNALNGDRQLTVFAPNNDAFGDLLNALGVDSLDDIPVDTLRTVLLYHVTPGRRRAASVVNADQVPTLQGTEIEVEETKLNPDGEFAAEIINPNLASASNGIIHEIDGVLNPADQADDEDDEDEEAEEADDEESDD